MRDFTRCHSGSCRLLDGKTYDRPKIEAHFTTGEPEEERWMTDETGRTHVKVAGGDGAEQAAICSAARRAIELTSPVTTQGFSGFLTPVHLIEQQSGNQDVQIDGSTGKNVMLRSVYKTKGGNEKNALPRNARQKCDRMRSRWNGVAPKRSSEHLLLTRLRF